MGPSVWARPVQQFAGPLSRVVIDLPFRMRATAGMYHINGSNYKSLDEVEPMRRSLQSSNFERTIRRPARDISLSPLVILSFGGPRLTELILR